MVKLVFLSSASRDIGPHLKMRWGAWALPPSSVESRGFPSDDGDLREPLELYKGSQASFQVLIEL